jgi:hypothetical protein
LGPTFKWNILEYGRILSNVRLQDAKFQELVATYQNTVLNAGEDVEDGLVTFLKAQKSMEKQRASEEHAHKAFKIGQDDFKAGIIDLTRLTQLETTLVQLQDNLAQARGQIALGLIQVYKALGGGWQIRCTGCEPGPAPQPDGAASPETLPAPRPSSPPAPGSQGPQAGPVLGTPTGSEERASATGRKPTLGGNVVP